MAGNDGVWMPHQPVFRNGNVPFNANTVGGTEYGDSFREVGRYQHLTVRGYFTPYNQGEPRLV